MIARKGQKQAEANRDGVINLKLQFQSIINGKFWCSQNATNQSNSTVEIGYMCPQGINGQNLYVGTCYFF